MIECEYLGWDLDDVIEGSVPIPIVDPPDRASDIVMLPALTDFERSVICSEYARDANKMQLLLNRRPHQDSLPPWIPVCFAPSSAPISGTPERPWVTGCWDPVAGRLTRSDAAP